MGRAARSHQGQRILEAGDRGQAAGPCGHCARALGERDAIEVRQGSNHHDPHGAREGTGNEVLDRVPASRRREDGINARMGEAQRDSSGRDAGAEEGDRGAQRGHHRGICGHQGQSHESLSPRSSGDSERRPERDACGRPRKREREVSGQNHGSESGNREGQQARR